MRALILTDGAFLLREPDMLRRLEVGLAGEGVSVVQALPDTAADLAESGLFAQSVVYPTRAPWFMERWRVRQLRDAMTIADAGLPGAEHRIDLVHVFGESSWGIGSRLARELGVPLIVEVWGESMVPKAASLGASMRDNVPIALLAPDRHIEEALLREDGSLPVRSVRWGVHCPPHKNVEPAPNEALGIMMIGSGAPGAGMAQAFEGLCRAAKRDSRAMIFVDAEAVRQSNVWSIAEEIGVLDSLTLVPRMEAARSLVLRGSILVCPEAQGDQRTIVLDAMAHAMGVIALRDPMVTYLRDGETAMLIQRPVVDDWTGGVREMIRDREMAERLGESARRYVASNHRVSTHVATVLDVYERVLSGESLPFPEPALAEETRRHR